MEEQREGGRKESVCLIKSSNAILFSEVYVPFYLLCFIPFFSVGIPTFKMQSVKAEMVPFFPFW